MYDHGNREAGEEDGKVYGSRSCTTHTSLFCFEALKRKKTTDVRRLILVSSSMACSPPIIDEVPASCGTGKSMHLFTATFLLLPPIKSASLMTPD